MRRHPIHARFVAGANVRQQERSEVAIGTGEIKIEIDGSHLSAALIVADLTLQPLSLSGRGTQLNVKPRGGFHASFGRGDPCTRYQSQSCAQRATLLSGVSIIRYPLPDGSSAEQYICTHAIEASPLRA